VKEMPICLVHGCSCDRAFIIQSWLLLQAPFGGHIDTHTRTHCTARQGVAPWTGQSRCPVLLRPRLPVHHATGA
jgi:hypothetical protein